MINLNDSHEFARVDPGGMLLHALNLPITCLDAWESGIRQCRQMNLHKRWGRQPDDRDWLKQIVIVGMGGSAIGGELLSALIAGECRCPILVSRGYGIPAYVNGAETLVIGSSHSGNTEETLNAFQQARERGASLLAVTTGGQLASLADEWDAPVVRYVYESQPRAALGYSFTLLISLVSYLGLVADKGDDVAEAADVMRAWQGELGPEVPLEDNRAKQLAASLTGRMPIVYGAGMIEVVARRWKTQFNENAKVWAGFEGMPELNHNAVVGYERSEIIQKWASVIMLHSRYDSSRIQTRWRITRELLEREGVTCEDITGRGESRVAQMLSLIHFGDLTSVYLALATEVDPTPVNPIAYLKDQLAESS